MSGFDPLRTLAEPMARAAGVLLCYAYREHGRQALDTDEWRKNREVLLCKLRDLEAGRPTEETIETVKQKLAKLDAKFHNESDA